MAETAADVLIDTIHDWGVDVIFGIPGDGVREPGIGRRESGMRAGNVGVADNPADARCPTPAS